VVVFENIVCTVGGATLKPLRYSRKNQRFLLFVAWENGWSYVRKHFELNRMQILKYAHIVSLLKCL
jgi:hypothetical protein